MMILRTLLFCALLLGPCSAAETTPDDLQSLAPEGQIDALKPAPAPRGQEWWRAVVRKNPACRVHSDGCQSCLRGDDSFSCSNPGIACNAGEWTCADLTH